MMTPRFSRTSLPTVCIACLLLVVGIPAKGEVFTWTDQDGTVHFGDAPPQNQPSKRVPLLKQSVGGTQGLSEADLHEAMRRATEAYYRATQEGRPSSELKRLETEVRQYHEEAVRRSSLSYQEQCRLGYCQCHHSAAPSYGEEREREALQRRVAAEAEEERQRQSRQRATGQYPPDYLEYIQGQCFRGVKAYCAKLPNP